MLRRFVLAFVLACTLVAPASATWSIIIVNRRTGEVAVGSATCIARINLLTGLPSVVPGVGAGVIQASGSSSDNVALTAGLRQGLSAQEILDLVLAVEPSPRLLQTGIVTLYPGAPITYTGRGVGRAKHGVVGEVGDLAYAIQGNVLAGDAVVTAAEQALLATNGDTGQKLMAAMVAARQFGGDGRCSCDFTNADSCGSPPPSFEKSAHVGFVVVARIGEAAPPCLSGNDCAEGAFHLRLNIRGANASESDPDPVDQLVVRYAEWRAARAGRPDAILSRVDAVDALPADGLTKRVVTVQLVDIDGVPLTHGGARVTVTPAEGARAHASLGPVVDLGDGRYRFTLAATTSVGLDRLVIRAEDDLVKATLYPYLEVRSEPPAVLHAGRDALSAAHGGEVPFVLADPAWAGANYLLLASALGTAPPTPFGRAGLLPLVKDEWFGLSARLAGHPDYLPGTRGVLDANGRAEAALLAPTGALLPLVGRRLWWAAVLATPVRATTTAPVGFDIVP
jgi:hypothetical protein